MVGKTEWSGGLWFVTMDNGDVDRVIDGVNMKNVSSVWFTNLDHGRRHQPLPLMTMEENLKYSKHKEIKGKKSYDKYDNYDAIEVSFTDAIPSDYDGVMGVPISFWTNIIRSSLRLLEWQKITAKVFLAEFGMVKIRIVL